MNVVKSAEAFRTISEAASEIDVPQHVLRHWEDVFGQIRPMRRAGGRRYYRPIDLDLLRGVRVLLYGDRYTTKGVQKIFKENGAKFIVEIGRRSAAGLPIDLRSRPSDEKNETQKSSPIQADTSAALLADPTVLPAQVRDFLNDLLVRLQNIDNALDEATLAIEAIDTDDE